MFKKINKDLKEQGVHIKKPTRAESVLLLLIILTFYGMNDAVNIISSSELGIKSVGTFFGSSYVLSYQFLFPLFLASLIFSIILLSRNMWKGSTHHNFDMFFGIVLMVAYSFMGIAIATQMMGAGTTYSIFWILGGIPKSTLFHIGVGGMVTSLLYYAFVE